MNYQGDYSVGQVVYIYFNTFDSNDPSASVTITNFVNTDVHVHKDDSTTQRNNAAGVTVSTDFDSITGSHLISIDTADNTVADFFEAGHDYNVRIEGTTVDAATVNAFVGHFSIANRRTAGQMAVSSIEGLTDQNTFTLTSGEASADDDAYNDCLIVITDQTTKIQKAVGYISDYTGSTRSVQLYASPLQTGFTMAVGDSVEIFATSAFVNVRTVNRTDQTAGDLAALINTVDDFLDTEMAAQTSNLVIIASDTVKIESDVAAIEVDTGTTLEARLSDVESSLVIIKSDIVVLDNAISDVESSLVITKSDLVVIDDFLDTEVASILSDTLALTAAVSDVESSLVIVKSDLVVIDNAVSDVESSLVIVKSDLVVVESDTTAIEAAGGSLTAAQDSKLTRVQSDVIIVASDVVIIGSDLVVVESNTIVIESDTIVISSDTAAIEAFVDGIMPAKNAALPNVEFLMVDDTDHVTPKTGLTPAGTRSIDGGAFAAVDGASAIAEVGNGIYQVDIAAADLNGDIITFRFTGTNADDRFLTIRTAG